jgi:hypothetical protein
MIGLNNSLAVRQASGGKKTLNKNRTSLHLVVDSERDTLLEHALGVRGPSKQIVSS